VDSGLHGELIREAPESKRPGLSPLDEGGPSRALDRSATSMCSGSQPSCYPGSQNDERWRQNHARRPEGTRPVDGVEIQETGEQDGGPKANRRVQCRRAHETWNVRTPDHLWFPYLRAHDDICARSADVGQLRRPNWIPCSLRRSVVGRPRWALVEPLSTSFLCLLYGGSWSFVGVLPRRPGD